MTILEINIDTARRIAVFSQLLNHHTLASEGKDRMAKIIDQIGYVQIDTISVVNRAHLHTLWARSHEHSEKFLHELQATDRRIYEYWGHAMSYLPMEEFRFSLPRMEKFKNPNSAWARNRIEKTRGITKEVKKRIQTEGPLSSKDFENSSGKKGGTWWDWKPAKIALEVLYWQGELMISERHGFQKVYDLTERVLPTHINTSFPSKEELSKFIIIGALRSFGIASDKEIGKFKQPGVSRDKDMLLTEKKDIKKSLDELTEAKKVVQIKISGLTTPFYLLSQTAGLINNNSGQLPAVRLLSPFDNLIIQRDRTKQLFDFDYSLECYVPEPKRKFGYFVFPILFGNNMVGRLDPKADRKNKTLILKNLWFEPDFIDYDNFLPVFTEELKQFAKFNNCSQINIEKCGEKKILTKIRSELKKPA
jgi:uncharacterized protein